MSSAESPLASEPNNWDTVTRVPRTTGCPWQIRGSMVILSFISFSSLRNECYQNRLPDSTKQRPPDRIREIVCQLTFVV